MTTQQKLEKEQFNFGSQNGKPNIVVVCGNCGFKIMVNGQKKLLPYKIKCPNCKFEAKPIYVKHLSGFNKHFKRMFVFHMQSFAYQHFIEWKNGEEKKP